MFISSFVSIFVRSSRVSLFHRNDDPYYLLTLRRCNGPRAQQFHDFVGELKQCLNYLGQEYGERFCLRNRHRASNRRRAEGRG